LNDGNALDEGGSLIIDGESKRLAVYERDTGIYVDVDGVNFKPNTTYYYVDIPIAVKVNGEGKLAVNETKVTFTVTAKDNLTGSTADSETVVRILPRGLFDLD